MREYTILQNGNKYVAILNRVGDDKYSAMDDTGCVISLTEDQCSAWNIVVEASDFIDAINKLQEIVEG